MCVGGGAQMATIKEVGESGCTEKQLADEGTETARKRGGGGGGGQGLACGLGGNWAVLCLLL